MDKPRLFVLRDGDIRRRAADFILHEAPDGCEVLVTLERMPEGKRKRFHAVCGELAKSHLKWAGEYRTQDEWKRLLISGHAKATGLSVEVVQGIEGELVDVRESTTRMSGPRGRSLVMYSEAFAINNGVHLKDLSRKEEG